MIDTVDSLSLLGSIVIVFGGLLLTVLALYFVLKQDKAIKASDGTRFSSEEECFEYEKLLKKVFALYQEEGNDSFNVETFGLEADFLKLLKNEGFSSSTKLLKYKNQFLKLTKILSGELD